MIENHVAYAGGLVVLIGLAAGLAMAQQQQPYNPYSSQNGGFNPYSSDPIMLYNPPIVPIAPESMDECNAMQDSYQKSVDELTQAHDDCLQRHPADSKVEDTKTECSRSACQALHLQKYNAEQDAKRIQSAFDDCASAVQDLQKRQQEEKAAQARAAAAAKAAQDRAKQDSAGQKQAVSTNQSAETDRAQRQADADARRMDQARWAQQWEEQQLEKRTQERNKQTAAVEQKRDAAISNSHESQDAQKQIAQLEQNAPANNANPLGTASQWSVPSADDFVLPDQSGASASTAKSEFTTQHGPAEQVASNSTDSSLPSPSAASNTSSPLIRPTLQSRAAYYYNGQTYSSYDSLISAARAHGNCAPHPETGQQAACDRATVGATNAVSQKPPSTPASAKKGAAVFVAFAFSMVSSIAVELSGNGAYGVGISTNSQAAIDEAMNRCAANVTPGMLGCSTAGVFVGSRDGSLRWYALAINTAARPADNDHLWSDGEAIGYMSESDAEQNALALCQKPGADSCTVVLSGPVGGPN